MQTDKKYDLLDYQKLLLLKMVEAMDEANATYMNLKETIVKYEDGRRFKIKTTVKELDMKG